MAIKIFYDLETTGYEYKKHSIHQLSGMVELNSRIVEEFDFKIKPHPKAKIEDAALRVCGVTREQLNSYPDMETVFNQFKKLLKKYINPYDKTDKAWLVGFNNRSFDDDFLRMYFLLMGDQYFDSWFWSDSLDVMVLASQYLLDRRKDMPSFKLGRVAKELGIIVNDYHLHDASYDVKLTREIYQITTGMKLEI